MKFKHFQDRGFVTWCQDRIDAKFNETEFFSFDPSLKQPNFVESFCIKGSCLYYKIYGNYHRFHNIYFEYHFVNLV